MSSMPNVKTVNLGTNSLTHIAALTMNGLNELYDFAMGEGVMTSVGGIVIGSNSLNALPSFNFTGFGMEVDVDFELLSLFLSVEKSAFRIGLE